MPDRDDYCADCSRMHSAPRPCGFNPRLPCRACGHERGYRWTADDGAVDPRTWLCWSCAFAADQDGHIPGVGKMVTA